MSDQFGWSVAINGNRALVGAIYDDDTVSNSGSVYVFEYNGTDWIQTAKLFALDRQGNDYFGSSVALQGDRVVVGALGDDDRGVGDSGSAYIFEYRQGTWQQVGKLTAADSAASDNFGSSVAIDGTRIVVGSIYDDDNGKSNSGSAYVFEHNGSAWVQTAK